MANDLKITSSQISKTLDLFIKHAGEVVKFENEAIEVSKKIQEASFLAQKARNNMITVR
jgi:hypothetical protein